MIKFTVRRQKTLEALLNFGAFWVWLWLAQGAWSLPGPIFSGWGRVIWGLLFAYFIWRFAPLRLSTLTVNFGIWSLVIIGFQWGFTERYLGYPFSATPWAVLFTLVISLGGLVVARPIEWSQEGYAVDKQDEGKLLKEIEEFLYLETDSAAAKLRFWRDEHPGDERVIALTVRLKVLKKLLKSHEGVTLTRMEADEKFAAAQALGEAKALIAKLEKDFPCL